MPILNLPLTMHQSGGADVVMVPKKKKDREIACEESTAGTDPKMGRGWTRH